MKTSVDQIGKNKVRLEIEVPRDDVQKYVDRAYRKIAGEIRIPGFRPGKVPRPIIDQRVGKDVVRQEALRDALPELFSQAIETEHLDVVAPPELEIKSFEEGQDLTFEAVVEVRPVPELRGYTGLEIERPKVEVTADEVGDQVERLRVRYSSLETVPRPARQGDFALIDLKTYQHDVTIDELTAKDLLIEIGQNMIVPELDSELENKRAGEILKLTATLPERFGERAGWQVGMQVLVKEIKARNLPALDDELAKTVSEFETLDELRGDLRERLEKVKSSQADEAVRERTIERFLETGIEVDLPEGMVDMEVDRLIQSMARLLSAQGASIEQYMEAENLDVDALRQRFREQADRNLTLRLGLEAVARAESLEATEDDRDRELQAIANGTGRPIDDVRRMFDEGGNLASLDGDIIRTKALDLLVDRATITEEGAPAGDSAPQADTRT